MKVLFNQPGKVKLEIYKKYQMQAWQAWGVLPFTSAREWLSRHTQAPHSRAERPVPSSQHIMASVAQPRHTSRIASPKPVLGKRKPESMGTCERMTRSKVCETY